MQQFIKPRALQLKFTFYFLLLILFVAMGKQSVAQQIDTIPPPPKDTSERVIHIIQAKNLYQKTIDSATTIESASKDVIMKEGLTTIYCDSVVHNNRTNVVEAFGNVHINDNDSIHTYAQSLRYIGGERIAYLKKNVKLTDKKGVLLTDDLEYNLRTGIATYKNGGRVLNGKTVLTSTEGVYIAETKDVFFKKNVHLVDPKYDIRTDSLKYNIARDEAEFITQTHIVSKEGVIDTKSGFYNLKTGQAIFLEGTNIRDSAHFISGNRIVSDDQTGIVQIDGNGKFVDSVNQVTVVGGHLEISRKENSFLAYLKPVMILYKNNDSTYIAADTLFSGLRKYDSTQKKQVVKVDTLKKIKAIGFIKPDSAAAVSPGDSIRKDTVVSNELAKTDTVKKILATNDPIKDTANIPANLLNTKDTLPNQGIVKMDTLRKPMVVNLDKPDSAIRYFLAFHHVRIFNDSLQSVSDSLYYSTDDSTFKLFGQPVVWNGKSQVSGDTIHMYTENQKAKRLYVFYNGIIINQTSEQLFNQIAGRTINAYFKEGNIDYGRVKGSPAESIYYPQDDDSAYVGMNRTSGDVIDIYFVKKELNKVKFINNVDGIMYPIRQTPADKKYLKNFKWLDSKRPKNKLELFE